MAATDRATARTPKEETQLTLDLPTEAGAPGELLWDELLEETRTLDRLVAKLRACPAGLEREQLEEDLLSSLAHIRTHSAMLEDSVTEALFKADELEESPSVTPEGAARA